MKVIVFLIVMSFCLSGLGYAAEKGEALNFAKNYESEIKQENNNPKLGTIHPFYPHNWQLGTEIYYFRYREPDVMKEDGMMYGLTGAYTYRNNFMFRVEGRGAGGQVDYENSGTIDNITDYTLEGRIYGGYDFKPSDNFTITPYFGVGYRYLNDDSSGKTTSTNAAGYERESRYLYSPLGVEGMLNLKEGWSLGACVEYDIFWRGWQKSHLSDANANFSDTDNTQKKGYGIRGSVKLQKEGEKLDFLIEPFIRYWYIAKSEDSDVTYSGVIVGYGYEPKNNTFEYGIKFGVNF